MAPTAEPEPRAYTLSYATDKPEEIQRLDDMHEAMETYLGGTLSYAPIEDTAPKAILELGGAWAIQAAEQFPDADVLAVDLAPLPPRKLPKNLKFQALNLTEPFPFESETFDIVHARFVFIHVPHLEDVLKRTVELVKPGGWLLLEDVENTLYDDGGLGPGQKTLWGAVHSYVKEKGVNPLAPLAYEGLLKTCGRFSEVNVKKIVVPISRPNEETDTSKLGAALKTFVQRASRNLSPEALAVTPEIAEQFREEMEDPNRNLCMNLYFMWSRKAA